MPEVEGPPARTPVTSASRESPALPSTRIPENQALGLGEILESDRFQITDEDLIEAARISVYEGGDQAWEGATAQMMQSSCAFMAQELLRGPSESPYNGRFLVGEHHEEWDYLVSHFDRVCVLAPRDHGKTFFFDFAYPIWRAAHEPRGIGFIFSATQPQAERILADIKTELETNPRLRWLVPDNKKVWSSTSVLLANGHRIYARGFGTKVRGAHPNWIVVDDGLNDETVYSATVRSKQNDYFYTAITNMVVPGGQIIVVGTPFHQDDLYADLERNEEYEFRRYQALDEQTGRALWPDRYSREGLEKRKREIGVIRFNREFQCVPVADDMSLFPGFLFAGDPVEQPTVRLGMPLEYWQQLGVTPYIGVDFAMSSSAKADYTVIWVMGTDAHGHRWIIDIVRERGLAYQKQLSLINATAQRYDPVLVYLESNQMQRIFGDELIRLTDLPIKKFTTGTEKHSLDKGVPSLRVLLENQKFRIPRGDRRSVELTDVWINEMRAFTWNEGKLQSVAAHDDTVMACWICDQAIRQGSGFSFSFGDELEADGELSLDDVVWDDLLDGDDEPVEDAVDYLVDVDDPLALHEMLRELRRAKAVVVGAGTPKGPVETDGCHIVRVFGDAGYVEFAMQNQGFGKFVRRLTVPDDNRPNLRLVDETMAAGKL
jgi:phage terminase large subunit-like protein